MIFTIWNMGQKYIKSIILYAVLGLLCFVNIGQLWKFALIFFGLAGFYFWLAYKHWNDEPDVTDKLKSGAKKGIVSMLTRKNRKERKQKYQNFLSELNSEFGTDDFDELDDYDEDEDGDEDDE